MSPRATSLIVAVVPCLAPAVASHDRNLSTFLRHVVARFSESGCQSPPSGGSVAGSSVGRWLIQAASGSGWSGRLVDEAFGMPATTL